jgi:hypothetical protein
LQKKAKAAPHEAPFVQLDRSSSLTGLDPEAKRSKQTAVSSYRMNVENITEIR